MFEFWTKAQNDLLLHLNWSARACARERTPPLVETVSIIVLCVLSLVVLLKSMTLKARDVPG